MAYFKTHPESGVTRPDQIAVVGDRLSTDIMMANMMGSYGVWVRDGVTGRGFVSHSSSCLNPQFYMHSVANQLAVREDGGSVTELPVQKGIQCA